MAVAGANRPTAGATAPVGAGMAVQQRLGRVRQMALGYDFVHQPQAARRAPSSPRPVNMRSSAGDPPMRRGRARGRCRRNQDECRAHLEAELRRVARIFARDAVRCRASASSSPPPTVTVGITDAGKWQRREDGPSTLGVARASSVACCASVIFSNSRTSAPAFETAGFGRAQHQPHADIAAQARREFVRVPRTSRDSVFADCPATSSVSCAWVSAVSICQCRWRVCAAGVHLRILHGPYRTAAVVVSAACVSSPVATGVPLRHLMPSGNCSATQAMSFPAATSDSRRCTSTGFAGGACSLLALASPPCAGTSDAQGRASAARDRMP